MTVLQARRLGMFGSTVLMVLSLSGCAGLGKPVSPLPDVQPQQPNMVSLQPQDWYVLYSNGVPSHPSSDPDGAWSFEFPNYNSGGHINYIETPFNATIPLHSITIVFKVESETPQFVVVDSSDHLPATCRLMIEQQNDDLADPNGRWRADASIYNLGSQDGQIITHTVALTPDQWTNVNGQENASAFGSALANIGWVGLTFSGQYFAGHGVAIGSGTAKFVLIGNSID